MKTLKIATAIVTVIATTSPLQAQDAPVNPFVAAQGDALVGLPQITPGLVISTIVGVIAISAASNTN